VADDGGHPVGRGDDGLEVVIDVDKLPPAQLMVLEVLAARTRLGHWRWPFDARLRRQLDALHGLGLIQIWNDTEAELTEAGWAAVMIGTYEPPDVLRQRDVAQVQLARIVRAAERWGGEHYDEILRILTSEERS
jgi:hypothetical protein